MTTPERSAILGDTERARQIDGNSAVLPSGDPHGSCSFTAPRARISIASAAPIADCWMPPVRNDRAYHNGANGTGPKVVTSLRFSRRRLAAIDQGIAGEGVPTGEFILGYTNHYEVIPPTPVVPEELKGSALLPPLMNPYHHAKGVRDLA